MERKLAVWHRIQKPESGFLNDLSECVAKLESDYPGLLADVSDGDMCIASDYSGQHPTASHEAYSFLVTTSQDVEAWEPRCVQVRDRFLKDGRRMAFKHLREPMRLRALPAFLRAADFLCGNLITILVDKRVTSLFKPQGPVRASELPLVFPETLGSSTVEKSLRIGTLLALLIASLRREQQRAFWITDRDEILEHNERREQFAKLVSWIAYGITGWANPAPVEFCTTGLDWQSSLLEDLLAIPDLAAGALARIAPLTLPPPRPALGPGIPRRWWRATR